jgi:glycosyltransferase involved in cell wall biosynthesis
MVSIIIPYKNAGLFLAETLDSIINQSYNNWELILVNDHSIDNSNIIAELYSKQDQRIKYFHSDGIGIIDALSKGYNYSKGDFITRMDADDIMHIDKIKLLRESLLDSGRKHVSIGLVNYFSSGKTLDNGYIEYAKWLNYLSINKLNFSEIFKECTIPSPCWMMYRDDFQEIGGFENKLYPEDYDLAFRMYINNIKICNVNKVIHQWRDHDSRTSRTDSKYDFKNFIPLKIEYFMKVKTHNSIILWGTGKKGKLIAKELIKKAINFTWITNNPNKYGKEIYGQIINEIIVLEKEQYKTIIIGISSKNFTVPKNNKFNDFISFY